MPRHRQVFSLTKIGKYWYYRTYSADGERTHAKSTGCTNKTDATNFCNDLYRDGKLGLKVPSLRQWVDETHWWIWDQCDYIASELEASPPDEPRLTERYAHDARRKLEKYILPEFGDKKLDAIRPADIERWRRKLAQQWTRSTAVNIVSVLSTMLAEAVRLEIVRDNPFAGVKKMTVSKRERGVLSIDEARAVLDPGRWNNPIYYGMNLVAAFTAMRQGEILAVTTETLHPDHIIVDASWHLKYGRGPTKTKKTRAVPLPRSVFDMIREWLTWDGFVFSLTSGERPVTGNRVTEALYVVMADLDINRQERNLTFHSWRHFANTHFRRTGVPDMELKAVTGHATDAMSDRYTHFQPQDYRGVIAAQERLLMGGAK